MKNNSTLPAFPKDGHIQDGLSKREYFAAAIAPKLISVRVSPSSFLDLLKHNLNKIGFRFSVNYKNHCDAAADARIIAIYTDTILNQLNGISGDLLHKPINEKLS